LRSILASSLRIIGARGHARRTRPPDARTDKPQGSPPKQGAMDLVRPLAKAKLVRRVGTLKNRRYVLQ
jgi:hypothetical protein